MFVMNILDEPGKMSDLRVVGGPELLVELDDNPETEGGTVLILANGLLLLTIAMATLKN